MGLKIATKYVVLTNDYQEFVTPINNIIGYIVMPYNEVEAKSYWSAGKPSSITAKLVNGTTGHSTKIIAIGT